MGQDAATFWTLSPREHQVIAQGAINRLRRERNEGLAQAWHIAALGRVKKMPRLEKLLQEKPRATGRGVELQATIASWLASRKR